MNGKGIGWLARDLDGWLYFYEYEPFKKGSEWRSDGGILGPIHDDDYPQISWEDEDPTEVELTIKIKDNE